MSRRARSAALIALVAIALALWFARHRTARPVAAPVAPSSARSSDAPRGLHRPAALVLSNALADTDDDARHGLLEGRVVSSADGQGIAAATLTFEHRGSTASATTDGDGRFVFVPSDPGRYELFSVVATGFVPFQPELGHSPVVYVAEAGQRIHDIVLTLRATVEYAGVVDDLDGVAIPDVHIEIRGDLAGEDVVRVDSDAQGRFTFRAGDQAVLDASKPGYAHAVASLDFAARVNRHVIIRMARRDDDDDDDASADAPRDTLAGTVLDAAGDAVEGIAVTARRSSPGASPSMGHASSGADGRFTITGLSSGDFAVWAQGPGFTVARAEGVHANTSDLVLRLPGGARLHGTVRDEATGRPVAGFTVMLARRIGPLQRSGGQPTSVFDARGRYEVDPIAPGSYAVTVVAYGYAPSPEQTVTVPDPATGDFNADFALARGGGVRGIVLDATSHRPVVGARVEVESSMGSDDAPMPVSSATATDGRGAFALRGLASGPRSLLVSAQGYNGRIVSGVDSTGGEAPAVTVDLTPTLPGQDPHLELAGIGAMMSMRGDELLITGVMPGGGASASGLQPGDGVASVDGAAVITLGFAGAVEHIRGPEGTSVTLGIHRGDGSTRDVTVTRLRVQAP